MSDEPAVSPAGTTSRHCPPPRSTRTRFSPGTTDGSELVTATERFAGGSVVCETVKSIAPVATPVRVVRSAIGEADGDSTVDDPGRYRRTAAWKIGPASVWPATTSFPSACKDDARAWLVVVPSG